MDDLALVGIVQRLRDLPPDVDHLLRRGRDELIQRIALDVLDDQKIDAVFLVDVVDRHDAGVIQLSDRRCFLKEALARRIFDVRQQNLQRHVPTEPLVAREIDRRGRAFAQELDDLVAVA